MSEIRVLITDAELRSVEALQRKTPNQFSVGQWLIQRLYDNGLVHDQAVQSIRTENHAGDIVLVIEQ